jgi:hypothetical protein
MTAAALFRVCLSRIEAEDSAWVETLRDKALAAIAGGGGSVGVLVEGEENGKRFQRQADMNAVEVADVCERALAEADGDQTSSTIFDFSKLGF